MSQTPSQPIPSSSGPPPLPVLPVEGYAPPPPPPAYPAATEMVYPRRPALITGIGVASIVVAALGILASLYALLALLGLSTQVRFAGMRAAMMPPALPAPPMVATPTTAPAAPAKPAPPVGPRGLEPEQRASVAAGLSELRFLTPPRLEQLDVLLAKAGQDMFPHYGPTPLTSDRVEDMVLGHAAGLSANPNVAGPDTFRTKGGRFEVYDDRAVFYPNGGEIVRATTLTSTSAGLTAEQVERVVQQAQLTSGNTINPSQLAALRTLLSTPGQQHVSPITLPTAVRGAQAQADGSVTVNFPNGWASIGPQGQTVSSTNPGTAPPFAGATGRLRVNGAALAIATFAVVVGLGLALFLLVCGILMLRNSMRARRLHLAYAVLKIPVAIAGALAVWWLTSGIIDTVQRNANLADLATAAGVIAAIHIVLAGLGLLYPLALLIVLQTRAVKTYYRSGGMNE